MQLHLGKLYAFTKTLCSQDTRNSTHQLCSMEMGVKWEIYHLELKGRYENHRNPTLEFRNDVHALMSGINSSGQNPNPKEGKYYL